jgi:hypothetical protein
MLIYSADWLCEGNAIAPTKTPSLKSDRPALNIGLRRDNSRYSRLLKIKQLCSFGNKRQAKAIADLKQLLGRSPSFT